MSASPIWIVTLPAKAAILSAGLPGVHFDTVEISKSEHYEHFYGNRELPHFAWLKVDGRVGQDDFAVARDRRLVVSERALNLLQTLGIPKAEVSDFEA